MSKAHREMKGNESDTNNNSSRNQSFPRPGHRVHPVPAHVLSCAFMNCTRGVDEETEPRGGDLTITQTAPRSIGLGGLQGPSVVCTV